MRLNTELAARAGHILGSSIVGAKFFLLSVIHDFCALFMKLTKKLEFFSSKSIFFSCFSFSFQPTVHNGRVSRGRVCGCGCWLSDRWQVVGDRWHVTGDKVTHDRWHVTRDTWHMTHDTWHMTWDTRHFYLLLKSFFCCQNQKPPWKYLFCLKRKHHHQYSYFF